MYCRGRGVPAWGVPVGGVPAGGVPARGIPAKGCTCSEGVPALGVGDVPAGGCTCPGGVYLPVGVPASVGTCPEMTFFSDLDPMTLVLKPDKDIAIVYLHSNTIKFPDQAVRLSTLGRYNVHIAKKRRFILKFFFLDCKFEPLHR